MSALAKQRISAKEYLALERAHPELKSEFVDGEIFAMAGASEAHVTISTNIASELHQQFKCRPCKAYSSDMRVKVDKRALGMEGDYVYPDVVALCDKPELVDKDNLSNPKVVIEVLSDSTEAYDLGKKSTLYRSLPSVEAYLLVAQTRIYVAYYQRHENDTWLLREYTDLQANIDLPCVQATLTLEDIYDKVDFTSSTEHSDS